MTSGFFIQHLLLIGVALVMRCIMASQANAYSITARISVTLKGLPLKRRGEKSV